MASRRSPASRVLRNRPLNPGSLIHVQPYTTHICGQESRWDYLFSVKKREFPKINWGRELLSVRGVAQPSAHLLGSLQSLPMGRQASMSSQRITPSSGSSTSSGLTLRNEKLQGWEPLSWQLPLQKVTSATSAKVCAVSGSLTLLRSRWLSHHPENNCFTGAYTTSKRKAALCKPVSSLPPSIKAWRSEHFVPCLLIWEIHILPSQQGWPPPPPHLPAQTFSVLFTILPLTPGLCGGFFTAFL